MAARGYVVTDLQIDDLLDALALALPFVEEAERDPAYKRGVVAKLVKRMRDIIERHTSEQGGAA